ncbi:MAG TPA: LytTR family DNA-binding domain-containing protein [Gaiellales bacterium]|jgi:DNA-binding LytR/AlgR family response regulator|nr:LytTR family DNA-binding domain-containing protein [Gaiellales bacterium]
MSEGLTLLAVDDELPALHDLARMLRASAAVAHVDSSASGEDALGKLARRRYDGVFLDVRMPGVDGLELAGVVRRFGDPPAIVFVSAYENAAVEAFELHVLDYLVKPVSRHRIDEAINRVAAEAGRRTSAEEPGGEGDGDAGLIPVSNLRGRGTRLLPRAAILYVEAQGDFVRIYTEEGGRYLLRASLADLSARWSGHAFVRVHRRYVVNLRRAVEVRPNLNGTADLVLSDGSEVPVARRNLPDLLRRLRL